MAGGRFRGVAPGVAVAVVVIAVVSVIAVYQVMRAYSAAYTALVEYAVQAQKPVFRVTSVSVNSTHAIFRLVNEGPVAAYVRSVLLFWHASGAVGPVGADVYSVGLYVPVGGAVEVSVPLSNLTRYLVADQPVRFAVETDRGPVLTSLDARGEIRVNIVLPRSGSQVTLVRNDSRFPTHLIITCPAGSASAVYRAYIVVYPSVIAPEGYTVIRDEDVVSVHGRVPAIGPCLVTFNATLQNPVVLVQDWSRVSGVDSNAAELVGAFAHRSLSVSLRAVADVRPGYMSTVDFNIPEVYALRERFDAPQAAGSYVVDFSWYFFGEDTRNPGRAVSTIGDYSGTGNFVVRPHPYIVTARILASGALTAYSPTGCVVYPTPSMNPTAIPRVTGLEPWDWYEYTPSDVTGNIGFSTGAVLIMPNPLNTTYCSQPLRVGDRLLVAEVPIRLATGRHMVVPVFTYDDADGSNNFRVKLIVEVVSPEDKVVFSEEFEDEVYGVYGPIQYANPILVDANVSGVWTVRISVSYLSHSGGVNFLKLVVSKVVVVPIVGSPVVCSFDAPFEPTFPFANVTMQTGTVDRITPRPFIGRVEFRTAGGSVDVMLSLSFYSGFNGQLHHNRLINISGTANNACTATLNGTSPMATVLPRMFCPQGFWVTLQLFGNLGNTGRGAFVPYLYDGDNYGLEVDKTTFTTLFEPSEYEHVNYEKAMLYLRMGFDAKYETDMGFNVTVRVPWSGRWYVFIPFSAWSSFGFANRPRVDGGIAYSYFDYGHYVAGLFVREFNGTQVTFRIYFPVSSDRNRPGLYVIHGVFVAPALTNFAMANPGTGFWDYISPQPTGTVVYGVSPRWPGQTITFSLIEKSTGETVGLWTYTPVGNETANVLLPFPGTTLKYWPWLWFAERPAPRDFVLVVQGAKC